jgi:tetratricopeptide (TPR) repeat protein
MMRSENQRKTMGSNIRPGLLLGVVICVLLVLASLTIYWQTRHYPFINYDDNLYVTENFHIQKGVSLENLKWAIHATHAFNWHPLTWLSHMVDIEIYGLGAGGHHMTNVLFHMANTLLLFVLLKGMTCGLWPSVFVAALFALHPLHVESVVWISERKDVLSTFFGLLTLISYMRYTQHRSRAGYGLALLFFILGLMAKPMLVTLPFVMLLLDYWPLGRVKFSSTFRPKPADQNSSVFSLVSEKLPFFMLTAASCVVTYYAQQNGGAVMPFDIMPLGLRISNAVISYIAYMGKMFWPVRLAVIYPYPDAYAVWKVAAAVALLLGIFILVIMQIRRRPYLAVGWFWYFGTLVPVIGLLQVGIQAFADRYTYVPLVGLFIMIAWGIAEIVDRWRLKPALVAPVAIILTLVLITASRSQVYHWANDITLYSHALKITEKNFKAHNNLAAALSERGRHEEALFHMTTAVELSSHNPSSINNLGYIQMQQGRYEEAIINFRRALDLNPNYLKAHQNLAMALIQTDKIDEAVNHYRILLDIAPDSKDVLNDLANAMVKQRRITEALSYYSKALDLDPNDAEIHNNFGVAWIHMGRFEKAVDHFRRALQLNQGYIDARENLKKALKLQQGFNKRNI